MASLREIKDRIGSVRSTLKITSAMKLVASSKLRKSQKAIEAMIPYRQALEDMLSKVSGVSPSPLRNAGSGANVAVIAVSSNSSLCGSFNANVAKAALAEVSAYDDACLIAIGRKMAEAARRAGFAQDDDWSSLVGKPSASAAAEFADKMVERFLGGEFSRILFVYNHFVSTAKQEVLVEQFLPLESACDTNSSEEEQPQYILEPSRREIEDALLPKVLSLKVFTVLLDSAAAEHAARTVAMQTATDNAGDLLSELTLEYNKGRQQKITSEILDIVAGSAEQ